MVLGPGEVMLLLCSLRKLGVRSWLSRVGRCSLEGMAGYRMNVDGPVKDVRPSGGQLISVMRNDGRRECQAGAVV